MDDDVRAVLLDQVLELLPPRTTEYRSSAARAVDPLPAEPATEPIRIPASPLPAS